MSFALQEILDDGAIKPNVLISDSSKVNRVGIVTTVYRAQDALSYWSEYHLSLGISHIILIFDHLEDPYELATAQDLQSRFEPDVLTIWDGRELARTDWKTVANCPGYDQLLLAARSESSSFGVSARQSLNASAALLAAQNGKPGLAPLDWLLHLDQDELFYLEGRYRGGESLHEHFSTLKEHHFNCIRYTNHELLLPREPHMPLRFKCNPLVAANKLGKPGWTNLKKKIEKGSHGYFSGYTNGKSAVNVYSGSFAAGIHSWWLREESTGKAYTYVAGPSILHYRFQSGQDLIKKYMRMATSKGSENPMGSYQPLRAEREALDLINRLQGIGTDIKTIEEKLYELWTELSLFTAREVMLLEEAGLLFSPNIDQKIKYFV